MQPTKRQRSESGGGPPADPIRSDVWFDDGNLIVQAHNTQFRVFKGPLCHSSKVLKDAVDNMGDSKGVDECPVLFLSDSATDLGHVLRTVFYRWAYPDGEPLPIGVIIAFLRLGRKYKMKHLYDNGFSRLSAALPATVDDYLFGDMKSKILFRHPEYSQRRAEVVVDGIVIARELNLLCLLPAAFWFASMYPEPLADSASLLPEADRRTIQLAVKPLRLAYADYLFGWLDEAIVPSPDCVQPKACCDSKIQRSLIIWRPPGLSLNLGWNPSTATGLCKHCIALGQKHQSEGRKKLWNKLPSFFNLPSWDELLAPPPN
ncbi:hypothetical protein B0H16DRAFT_1362876 [Mycena metata]|uniref:BTB domain-containing protein n=1 Tax=Mycena metata TaxID=1033252 RepID=A0AAD7K1T2_9AGAR|nr:hypothetical protein B0H16DRAFT_1362876 [Mycena metata]